MKNRVKYFAVLFTTYFLMIICLPVPSYAQFNIGNKFGFGKLNSLGELTDKLIPSIFAISATLVTLYFIIGAYDYLKSGADKEALSKARKMIVHSIVGFILLIFAFFVIEFIPQFFEFSGWNIIR